MLKFEATTLSDHIVTVVGPIVTDEDRKALRDDVEFHDGTVALLTYPSKVLAFWSEEPPRVYNLVEGSYLMKGEAGDFRIVLNTEILETLIMLPVRPVGA